VLDARDQHGCVEGPQLRPLSSHVGSCDHLPVPTESILRNHFTLNPALLEQTRNTTQRVPPPGAWNTLLSTSLSQKPDRSCRQ
jgi:hypothetical protein